MMLGAGLTPISCSKLLGAAAAHAARWPEAQDFASAAFPRRRRRATQNFTLSTARLTLFILSPHVAVDYCSRALYFHHFVWRRYAAASLLTRFSLSTISERRVMPRLALPGVTAANASRYDFAFYFGRFPMPTSRRVAGITEFRAGPVDLSPQRGVSL